MMLQELILGGYTKRVNTGIRTIRFDESLQSARSLQRMIDLDHPTYLCLSQDQAYLFSITKEGDQAGVAAFKKQADETWQEVHRLLFTSIPACHLAYDSQRRCLYVSNYHLGRLDVISFNQKDHLKLIQTIDYNQEDQNAHAQPSHIHYAGLSKDGRFLWVCDLGKDTVMSYLIQNDGSLRLIQALQMATASGPRHLIEHPQQNWLYLVNELNNQTTLITFSDNGRLRQVQSWPTTSQTADQKAGAAIKISQDGRFLYVSTRFIDQVTVFEIEASNGQLARLQEISTCGKVPRDFALSADQKWLFVAHQESDYISLFERDQESGLLTFIHNETYAPECVCVLTTQSESPIQ